MTVNNAILNNYTDQPGHIKQQWKGMRKNININNINNDNINNKTANKK